MRRPSHPRRWREGAVSAAVSCSRMLPPVRVPASSKRLAPAAHSPTPYLPSHEAGAWSRAAEGKVRAIVREPAHAYACRAARTPGPLGQMRRWHMGIVRSSAGMSRALAALALTAGLAMAPAARAETVLKVSLHS